jgi:hypothetical protein
MRTGPRTVVGVDLDDVGCYHAIHGLRPPPMARVGTALMVWLPRFLELFAELGVRATFFAIGADVKDSAEGSARLRDALADGHEVASHSHAHAYDLVRWPDEAIAEDLGRCDVALREIGAEVEGFRAPGYLHDARLLRHVAAMGYRYDSSALPSPPYWAAKVTAMGAMAIMGRRSASLAGEVSSFLGARDPGRDPESGLWRLPISVSPTLRLPLIGTTLLSGPSLLAARLRHAAERLRFLNLELHAIDLADPDRDDLTPDLVRRQPELRVPLSVRRERLRALLQARGGGAPLREAVPG